MVLDALTLTMAPEQIPLLRSQVVVASFDELRIQVQEKNQATERTLTWGSGGLGSRLMTVFSHHILTSHLISLGLAYLLMVKGWVELSFLPSADQKCVVLT